MRYERGIGAGRIVVILNLGAAPQDVALMPGRILLSTHMDRDDHAGLPRPALRPSEGVVIAAGEGG